MNMNMCVEIISLVFQEKEQRAKEKLLLKQQEEALKLAEQKRKEAEREQKRKYVNLITLCVVPNLS